jgi:hypothetical protein
MIIIWRGLGFLVVVVVLGLLLLAQTMAEHFSGNKQYWQEHGWPVAASLLASGMICWLLGSARDGAVSESDHKMPTRDSLFFIRLRWWGPILIALAVAYLASGQTPGQPHSLR